jgi:hypothetical protein
MFRLFLKLLDGAELLILIKVSFVKPALHIRELFNLFFCKGNAEIIHKFSLCKILAALLALLVQRFGQDLALNVDVFMVHVVGHRDHTRRRDAPTEASGAHLSVKRHEDSSLTCFF